MRHMTYPVVLKRDGRKAAFETDRITKAITAAIEATKECESSEV